MKIIERKMKNDFNPIVKSEIIILEYVLLLFFIIPYLFFQNITFQFYLLVGFIYYIISVFVIRKIYYFSDNLLILYPTRIFLRKRKIEYSRISRIRYINQGMRQIPEIQIRFKHTPFFHFYVSISRKKRYELLNYLYRSGLNIEIKSDDTKDNEFLSSLKNEKMKL